MRRPNMFIFCLVLLLAWRCFRANSPCVILGVSPLAFYDGIMFARRRLASPSFVIIVISCVRFRLSLLNPLGAIVFVFPSGRFVSKAIPAKTFCTG